MRSCWSEGRSRPGRSGGFGWQTAQPESFASVGGANEGTANRESKT